MTMLKIPFKAGAAVVLIFVFGFFAGIGTVTTFLFVKKIPAPPEHRHALPPFEHPAGLIERMVDRLNIRPDQREALADIIESTRRQLHELRIQHRPEIKKILEKSRKEIRSLLDEEQKKQFDRMVDERRKRFDRVRKKFNRYFR